MFDDGEPRVHETPLVFHEELGLSFGERLEIMYDVDAFIRRNQPTRDLARLTRRAYLNVLRALAGHHDARALAVMRRLKIPSIRRLIAKALEDMPADELSNQLVLPLDGSYAESDKPPPVDPEDAPPTAVQLPSRTRWTVQRELEFVQAACLALANLADVRIVNFEEAEILEHSGPTRCAVRIPVPSTAGLLEGDRLLVFQRGRDGVIGALKIDLLDTDAIVGRLSWDDPPQTDLSQGRYYAKPRRGPTEFIAGMVNAMVQEFARDGRFPSPALNMALGVEPTTCEDAGLGASREDLDPSQARAWANAVHDANRITLIQGPPGTGKTHVLEQVLRELCYRGARILVTAPSNTAVDNVCRRVLDLPVLRTGNDRDSIAADIAEQCWIRDIDAVQRFAERRKNGIGCVYAGTHIGILKDEVIQAELEKRGTFDAILFDEAGMARVDEFLLCARLATRLLLFGDHQQLPPFPLPDEVREALEERITATRHQWRLLGDSALQWLVEERGIPVYMLQASYRCQNPRLMRFSSTLFYDARVRASKEAEYYQLSFRERQAKYPPTTLRIYRTSQLPLEDRRESLVVEGSRPGLENPLEARLCLFAFAELIKRYPLREIVIIAPYRRQVRLIRSKLTLPLLRHLTGHPDLDEAAWRSYLYERISTVDSFQGNESDAVIICYVRSGGGIGFVDDAQRINVAHTRCRRELIIIGDLDHLKTAARTPIFERMERAVARDGQILDITPPILQKIPNF